LKIIILTQYFPPEVGAAQNRLYDLAVRLGKMGVDVTVLTALPNYPQMRIYEGYKRKLYYYEEFDGIKVHRSWIFVKSSKSIFLRLLNYFSFVFFSLVTGLFKLGRSDFLLCESPPLFLGISAYVLSRAKRARLIFNVSDLWPESAEKLGLVNSRLLLAMAGSLEKFMYKKSALITGQTQGIISNIAERFPEKKVYWLKNGIDPVIFDSGKSVPDWRKLNGFSKDDFILYYGGIMGHAQGLEVILKAAKILENNKKIKFVLAGSGPVKDELINKKERLFLSNVYFFEPVPRDEMLGIIASIDVAIIPLKNIDLFRGAIPSKIFENLAMEKPVLLGVEGEAKELFIDQGKCGLAFKPEDEEDLKDKILYLYQNKKFINTFGKNGREYVIKYFNREMIARDFYQMLEKI
jgi:glycosyltransferase involved in cell wall biosynthesis